MNSGNKFTSSVPKSQNDESSEFSSANNNDEKLSFNDYVIGVTRMLVLWISVFILSMFFASAVLILYPFTRVFDRNSRSLHHIANIWAGFITVLNPWWKFIVKGRENLPANRQSVVYVSNHQSQSDILAIFLLKVQFRWLSKASIFSIPFFGWAMSAIGYVPVRRGERSSHAKCMALSMMHLKAGISMCFFPEGTRTKDGKLTPFKSGAFRLAKDANVPVVPITILGTEKLLPKGAIFPRLATVEIIVHPAISSTTYSVEELIDKAEAAVASALPPSRQRTLSSTLLESSILS
jgi:1-acyl-sn-glycerol-3-phosphate acyltransferase